MQDERMILPVIAPDGGEFIASIAGELMDSSKRIYIHDAKVFAKWLQDGGIVPETIRAQDVRDYRGHLLACYSNATAKRMFSVACRLLKLQDGVQADITKDVRGIKAEDESPHIALTKEQAGELLGVVDRSTKKGMRDYALLSLLLYTGLRRFETAALMMGDMGTQQGHHVLTIQEGKGKRRAIVKVPVVVWRAIQDYLETTGRAELPGDRPLFVQFGKGDVWKEVGISAQAIYRTVLFYAEKVQIEGLTPHGLRASFITLALEGGAKLEQVQYAARHKDPKMTERYWRRKLNLDDNAVDYIHIGSKESV